MNRLEETQLRQKKFFYNKSNKSDKTYEEYEHARKVWKSFNIKNLRLYPELYNKTDVLILAGIFEDFIDVCIEAYNLDPFRYYAVPGLAWDAMLK